jgi:hypothetical protein
MGIFNHSGGSEDFGGSTILRVSGGRDGLLFVFFEEMHPRWALSFIGFLELLGPLFSVPFLVLFLWNFWSLFLVLFLTTFWSIFRPSTLHRHLAGFGTIYGPFLVFFCAGFLMDFFGTFLTTFWSIFRPSTLHRHLAGFGTIYGPFLVFFCAGFLMDFFGTFLTIFWSIFWPFSGKHKFSRVWPLGGIPETSTRVLSWRHLPECCRGDIYQSSEPGHFTAQMCSARNRRKNPL